jgi:hypothetical protein
MTTAAEFANYPHAAAANEAANVWRNAGTGQYVFNDLRHSFTARTLAELEAGIAAWHAELEARTKAVATRQEIERKVIRRAVQAFIAAGYTVSHYDGARTTVKRSRKVAEVMAELHATDVEQLRMHDAEGKPVGSVVLVYGNDGYDVLSDYSPSLEAVLAPVNAYAETLA